MRVILWEGWAALVAIVNEWDFCPY